MLFRGLAAQPPQVQAPVPLAPQPVSTPATLPPVAVRPFLDSSRGEPIARGSGDVASEVERFREAVQGDPDDGQSLNALGQALVRAGRPGEAIQYLQRAVTGYPNVWDYRFNLARAYSQMENWTRAIPEYEAALALSPDDSAALYNLGSALHHQGREDEAIARYQRAIELAPAEPSVHLALGISYERLKRPREAADAYRRYLELAPDALDADRVKTHIQALAQP
jgi:tetratricopeptide (TPR) repeat protein